MDSYRKVLSYIYSLRTRGVKFGLDNERYLLSRLGVDYDSIPVFHIAGTNGKGSVSAFISTVLKLSGYKVGLYTSPHLVRFTERISISGKPISIEELLSLMKEVVPVVKDMDEKGMRPTFFEVVTALAFLYFYRAEVDVAVLEVGMGGRLDATNVVKKPLVSVITNVAMDHQMYLGYSLKEIAYEKSGIIKEGCPVISGVVENEPAEVVKERSGFMGAPLYVLGKDFSYEVMDATFNGTRFDYLDTEKSVKDVSIHMLGMHQVVNASIAIKAIKEQSELNVFDDDIKRGLEETFWPGRFEVVRVDGKLLILDGAHNCNGASALGKALSLYLNGEKISLVVGILGDKDAVGMLKFILPSVENVIVTSPDYYRAMDEQKLASVVRRFLSEEKIKVVLPVSSAVEAAIGGKNRVICITGSLYTVGEARSYLEDIGLIEKNV